MPDRPAHDLAQNVAATVVAGKDPVGDQESCRAGVVGNHPHRDVVFGIGVGVGLPGDPGGKIDDRSEEVCLVVRRYPLQHGGDPFETGPGVDRRGRQGFEPVLAGGLLDPVVLHEDEVPDLDRLVARPVDILRAIEGGIFGVFPHVVVDLGARPAGPRLAHLPEVVFAAKAQDSLWGSARLAPEVDRLLIRRNLVIPGKDAEPEPRRVHPELPNQQFHGKADRVRLEVVPEGEVPEHLEEGVVASGLADLVEIVVLASGTDTLLGRRRTSIVAPLCAEKDILELVHPCVDEEQGWIVGRQERRRLDDLVPLSRKIVEELRANFTSGHLSHGCLIGDSLRGYLLSSGTLGSFPSRIQVRPLSIGSETRDR